MNNEIEMCKSQEAIQNMINFGAHKELAKWYKALFDAYVEEGFDKEQALRLVTNSPSGERK